MYPGGFYGHFLHLILDNFTTHGSNSTLDGFTFDKYGGSHFQDFEFNDAVWDDLTSTNNVPPYFICHLFNNSDESSLELFNTITNTLNKNILIEYTRDYRLLAKNNVFDKRCNQDVEYYINELMDGNVLNSDTVAAKREWISYKLFHDKWMTATFPIRDNVLRIDLHDILYNFENVITRIAKFLNTDITDMVEINSLQHEMLELQQHLFKDMEIKTFLADFVNQIDCNLPKDCSIIDEAFIQHYLRDELELEIRCDDIGAVFPNTTTKLWEYTYPVRKDI